MFMNELLNFYCFTADILILWGCRKTTSYRWWVEYQIFTSVWLKYLLDKILHLLLLTTYEEKLYSCLNNRPFHSQLYLFRCMGMGLTTFVWKKYLFKVWFFSYSIGAKRALYCRISNPNKTYTLYIDGVVFFLAEVVWFWWIDRCKQCTHAIYEVLYNNQIKAITLYFVFWGNILMFLYLKREWLRKTAWICRL